MPPIGGCIDSSVAMLMRPFGFLRKFVRILGEVSLVLVFLVVLFFLLATALYFAEHRQPFATSPHTFVESLYFSAVTALTIGYGDIVPHSGVGRCLSLALALIGVTLTGIIAAAAVKALEMQIKEAAGKW